MDRTFFKICMMAELEMESKKVDVVPSSDFDVFVVEGGSAVVVVVFCRVKAMNGDKGEGEEKCFLRPESCANCITKLSAALSFPMCFA